MIYYDWKLGNESMVAKLPKRKGGLRKIAPIPKHDPPMNIVLQPGTYEYTCPGCGEIQIFTVHGIYF